MRARLVKYPGDFVALANLGSALQTEGRFDEAITSLLQAVSVQPHHAVVRNIFATALRGAGRLDDEFERALGDDPSSTDAEYNLAVTLLARNRPAEALPHLRNVVHVLPGDAHALADLGAACAMLNRTQEAVHALEALLRLAPDNGQAHFNLGLIAARSGKYDAAGTHFEAALRLDPSNREISGALAEARAALERSTRQRPK